MESRLSALAPRHDFAVALLPHAYTIHARQHMNGGRAREAAHWAERGLALARPRLKPDTADDRLGEGYWQAFWFGSVIAQAGQMAQSGKPAGLRRAVHLLRAWLPAVAPNDPHRAWGQSELAGYLGKLGQADAAIALSRAALHQAEITRPLEQHYRLRDHARLLADVGRPAQALLALQKSVALADRDRASAESVTRCRLMEAECLLALEDRRGADVPLRAAERLIRQHGFFYLKADLLSVAARFGTAAAAAPAAPAAAVPPR